MMKRILAIALTLTLSLALTACGGGGSNDSTNVDSPANQRDSGSNIDISDGYEPGSGALQYLTDNKLSGFAYYVAVSYNSFEKALSGLSDYDMKHLTGPFMLGMANNTATLGSNYDGMDGDTAKVLYGIEVQKSQNNNVTLWNGAGTVNAINPSVGEYHKTLTVALDTDKNILTVDERGANAADYDRRLYYAATVQADGTVYVSYTEFDSTTDRNGVSFMFQFNQDKGEFYAIYGTLKEKSSAFVAPDIIGGSLDADGFGLVADTYAEVTVQGGNLDVRYAQ